MQVKDEEMPRSDSRRARLTKKVQSARKVVATIILCLVLFASGFLMGLHARSSATTESEPTYTGIYQASSVQGGDRPVTPDTGSPASSSTSQVGPAAASTLATASTSAGTTAAPASPAASIASAPAPTPYEVLADVRWPAEGAIVKGPGWLYSLTLEHWVYLPGVDIQTSIGAPVTASLGGVVKSISTEPVLGNVLVLEHEGGVTTTYGRLATVLPDMGERVEPGEAIGTTGPDTLYFAVASGTEALDAQECLNRAR